MAGSGASFFDYPAADIRERPGALGFLVDRPQRDWELILDHAETRRFDAGEEVIRAGERDRALMLLTEGVLVARLHGPGGERVKSIEAPALLGEVAFLDGGPRSLTLVALTGGEVTRLSLEAVEVISAKAPELGRAILLDLGRIVAARLRLATEAPRQEP